MLSDFILYLPYGLVFFTLGITILAWDLRYSELGIARILWLLALFGLIHGVHEWLEMLERMFPAIDSPMFSLLRLITVSLSFLFLLYFGLFLNIITFFGDQALKTTPKIVKALLGISALSLIVVAILIDAVAGNDSTIRSFVAFPGGLLSGTGLIMYSRTARTFSRKVAVNFVFAGGFLICYSVLSGGVFFGGAGPDVVREIVILRSLSALGLLFFTVRALSLFNLEQHELINEKLLRFARSEKLASMGILAAGIAHEINNPLTNASLNLEMLKDLLPADPKMQKKASAIERNVNRAAKIAAELLNFSRDRETAFQVVDLRSILSSSCNLIKNKELSSIIQLRLQEVPAIMGIPWKLEEVFINVLMNSIDACSAEDSIEVECFSVAEGVQVRITDTGYGIPQADLVKVFDPFYTTKEIGKGTGLGLSVCYNIVRQHGGTIDLVSSEQGGTVITFSFPRASDNDT